MSASSLETIRTQLGDRYAIDRELGRGGMGAVFLARDLQLDRPVALKVLPSEFASDPSLRERFLRETRTAASFSHPNIVPVFAVEEREGLLAFAMGFVEGESLAARVARVGPLDTRTVVRALQDIGYALAYAHGRGVVHRDIKPDNIMIERATGRALLMDFGISRPITADVATPGLTRVGEVVGTPEFMSPEQATGDRVDGRTDIYSLGLVALFALTGRKPVSGTSVQQILAKQITEALPPATSLRPDIPAALGAAIDQCVAKEPGARYADAAALVDALDVAQLAPPDVPLAVRLFAQDLSTLSLMIFFFILLSPFVIRATSHGGALDALIPGAVIVAVAIARVGLSYGGARRLATDGFTADDILKGMRTVADERAAVRDAYRANPAIRARRRRTVQLAAAMAAGAVIATVLVMRGAKATSPGHYSVGVVGITVLTSAMICLAIALMLAMRSPFRAPPGDRIFEVIWLGPVGRAFVRAAARKTHRSTATPTPSLAPRTSPSAVAPAAGADTSAAQRLAELEARLAALEKDRPADR